jgi:hypothetical protein
MKQKNQYWPENKKAKISEINFLKIQVPIRHIFLALFINSFCMCERTIKKENLCFDKNNHDFVVNQSQFRRAKKSFIFVQKKID